MKTLVAASVLVFVAIPCGAQYAERSSFEVAIKVVDIDQAPVIGADIGFAWGALRGGLPDSGSVRKIADNRGIAVLRGRTNFGRYAYGARKDGFYATSGIWGSFDSAVDGKWQPWMHQLLVELKPIMNPVTMYAKRVVTDIPAGREWIGFDLQIGDWVPPYGNGSERDLEFLSECAVREFRYDYDGVLTVRFPNRGDGIQLLVYDPGSGSELKLPYQAPSDGYIGEFSWRSGRTPPSSRHGPSPIVDESNPQRAFIYRVRTVLDEEGKVISARYGKIPGPFIFDARGEHRAGFVNFTYYFNPDGTRNLEFDPKRNLFPGEPVLSP
jgi:hypothetical protein